MKHEPASDERWRQITTFFFRAPLPPSSEETEDFISRVMDRLAAESVPPLAPLLDWLGARWLAPALGLGFAAMLLSIAVPRPDLIAPPDLALLIGGQAGALGQLILPPDPTVTDPFTAIFSNER